MPEAVMTSAQNEARRSGSANELLKPEIATFDPGRRALSNATVSVKYFFRTARLPESSHVRSSISSGMYQPANGAPAVAAFKSSRNPARS